MQCSTTINGPTFDYLRARWRPLAEIFRRNGVLTEEDMDNLNVPFGNHDGKTKDARALHKQRAVLMNSTNCVQQYQLYKENMATMQQQRHINRLQRQLNKQESEEFKRKRDKYDEWFHDLSIK